MYQVNGKILRSKLVLGARDFLSRGRHLRREEGEEEVEDEEEKAMRKRYSGGNGCQDWRHRPSHKKRPQTRDEDGGHERHASPEEETLLLPEKESQDLTDSKSLLLPFLSSIARDREKARTGKVIQVSRQSHASH